MKNKHLVLLFLAVLAGGWISRRFSWRASGRFEREIIRIDTAETRQILLQNPVSGETLVFDRLENGAWAVTLGNKTLPAPPERLRALLSEIASLKSRGVAPGGTDSLGAFGLGPERAVQVRVSAVSGKMETFWLGKCRRGEGFSHLRLPGSPEIYEIEGSVSCALRLRFEDLRSRKTTEIDTSAVQSLAFTWARFPPLFFEKKGAVWQGPGGVAKRKNADLRPFFEALAALPLLGFADDFDDSRQRELLFGKISVESSGAGEALVLECFRSEKPLPQFVLRSSRNPKNYFYTQDTLVAKLFFEPLKWGPTMTEIPPEDAL